MQREDGQSPLILIHHRNSVSIPELPEKFYRLFRFAEIDAYTLTFRLPAQCPARVIDVHQKGDRPFRYIPAVVPNIKGQRAVRKCGKVKCLTSSIRGPCFTPDGFSDLYQVDGPCTFLEKRVPLSKSRRGICRSNENDEQSSHGSTLAESANGASYLPRFPFRFTFPPRCPARPAVDRPSAARASATA